MLKKEALKIIGGLSKPSKMPGPGYSLPASACKYKCPWCYAGKGRYTFKVVQDCLQRRLEALIDPRWVDAMVTAIWDTKYFRWHDSGDIQNKAHWYKILAVCRATPHIKHWIPTKRLDIVVPWLNRGHRLPENLTVRFSAFKLYAPAKTARGVPTSTIGYSRAQKVCPAPQQGGKCGDCRMCWDKKVKNIDYAQH